MVVEYIRYEVAAGDAEAFLAAYRAAGEDLLASPHCRSFEVARGVEEPQHFTVRIEWDSVQGHMEGFRKGKDFPPFLAKVRPFIGAIREMKHYAVLASGVAEPR
jgi:quinol monooxygenase YgiN